MRRISFCALVTGTLLLGSISSGPTARRKMRPSRRSNNPRNRVRIAISDEQFKQWFAQVIFPQGDDAVQVRKRFESRLAARVP